MLNNSAIRLATTSKLAVSPILPASLVLVGGVIIWRLWYKQAHLQTRANEMRDELIDVKREITEIKTEGGKRKGGKHSDDESDSASSSASSSLPLSSSFKKLSGLWSK